MQDLKIGQAVNVRIFSDVEYTEWPKFPSKDGAVRAVCNHPVEPVNAVIIGQVVKQLGTYNAATMSGAPWDGQEYDPPSISITGTVRFWQVRTGMMNKPMLVLDENLEPCAQFALPRIAPRPKYIQISHPIPPIEIAGLLTHDAR